MGVGPPRAGFLFSLIQTGWGDRNSESVSLTNGFLEIDAVFPDSLNHAYTAVHFNINHI